MGHKLKAFRKSKKMSQCELAQKSGISRTTISMLENNQACVTTTKTLVKLAAALETSVDQIFFSQCV